MLVLAREAVISVAVLVLAAKGARRIDVQWSGKAGTLALMFAFPLFLLADATSGTVHDVAIVGRVVLRRERARVQLLRRRWRTYPWPGRRCARAERAGQRHPVSPQGV